MELFPKYPDPISSKQSAKQINVRVTEVGAVLAEVNEVVGQLVRHPLLGRLDPEGRREYLESLAETRKGLLGLIQLDHLEGQYNNNQRRFVRNRASQKVNNILDRYVTKRRNQSSANSSGR
jgi:hypothetical protein